MYIPTVLKTMIHEFAADLPTSTIEELLIDYEIDHHEEWDLFSYNCQAPVEARNYLDLSETESRSFVEFIKYEYPGEWQTDWRDGWGYLLNAIHVFLMVQLQERLRIFED